MVDKTLKTIDKPNNSKEITSKRSKGSSTKFVYDELRREILSLKLPPGGLLDETTLSQRFSMSRSPIREAIVRLSADGLVEMLSNRSTLITPIDIAGFPRYVEALDLIQRVTTRLAAEFRTAADIELMVKKAEAFKQACSKSDYLAMSSTNKAFHMAIAKAGKNAYLTRAYGQLLDEGRRILHLHFDYIEISPKDKLLTTEHDEIVEAIKSKDVKLADKLAHAHSRQFHDRFMNFLSARYMEDF